MRTAECRPSHPQPCLAEKGIKGRLLLHPLLFWNVSPPSPVLLGGGGGLLSCLVADFRGTPVLGHPPPSWGPGACPWPPSPALSTFDSALEKSQC